MEAEMFANRVLAKMPEALFNAENCSLEELLALKKTIMDKYKLGWSFNDTVAYIKCTEYASPSLDEDIALRKMDAIVSKYNVDD